MKLVNVTNREKEDWQQDGKIGVSVLQEFAAVLKKVVERDLLEEQATNFDVKDIEIDGLYNSLHVTNVNGYLGLSFLDDTFGFEIHGNKVVVYRRSLKKETKNTNGSITKKYGDKEYLLLDYKANQVFWGADPHVAVVEQKEYEDRPKRKITQGEVDQQTGEVKNTEIEVSLPDVSKVDYFFIEFTNAGSIVRDKEELEV